MSLRRSRARPEARSEDQRARDRAERARGRAAREVAPAQPDTAAAPPLPPPSDDGGSGPVPVPPRGSPSAFGAQPRAHRRGLVLGGALVVLVVVAIVALVLAISHGGSTRPRPVVPVVVKVLVPEGETRAQIGERARAAGLVGSYLSASRRSPLLDPARYGAPAGTVSLEGFLFPATYDMYRGDPASRLVREQLVAFTENFGDVELRRARDLQITPYQLLTIASIIEREAQLAGDRAKVAAVIYNRLRLGMPLGIDATIRYALNDYAQPLTQAQLEARSPYNTRLHTGLPPTPISNPGIAAIEAAEHPAHVGYLYYVAGADGCGEQVFSTNYAQFERDAAAYHRAVSENGGRVPTCHKRL